jgi:hypothetical protein
MLNEEYVEVFVHQDKNPKGGRPVDYIVFTISVENPNGDNGGFRQHCCIILMCYYNF